MLPKQNPIASSKMFPTAGRSFRSERPLPEPCPSFDAARRARPVDVSGRPSPRHHLHAAGRKAGQQRRALACAAGASYGQKIGTGRFSSMVSTHLLTRLSTVAPFASSAWRRRSRCGHRHRPDRLVEMAVGDLYTSMCHPGHPHHGLGGVLQLLSFAAAPSLVPNTIFRAISPRHAFRRRCNVLSSPSG